MADRRKTVLVVDDDEGMRDTLTAVLRRDYRVLRAATGEAALQLMEKEDVDLMLLDVGPSRTTREIVELMQKVAKLPATVLVLGESGTGKELLARRIHRESADSDAPFIAVNVAAIPRELVESALFGH